MKKLYVFLALALLLTPYQSMALKIIPKDVVLVVDVSRSMIGEGNQGATTQNIFGAVQEKADRFIDNLNAGDTLTMATFGSETHVFPTVSITGQADRDKIKEAIAELRATEQKTYTHEMLIKLQQKLDELKAKDGDQRLQLAVIMTDAIDDPPPGKEKAELGTQAQQVDNAQSRYVYFVSLNSVVENNIEDAVSAAFPDAQVRNIDGEFTLSDLADEVIENLAPVVNLSMDPAMADAYKPFEPKEYTITLEANKLAAGLPLDASLVFSDPKEDKYFDIEPKRLTLKEGANKITLKSSLPIRYEGEYSAMMTLALNTELDHLIKPASSVELSVTAAPLSLTEKITNRPEFYIPLILLLLILLFLAYKAYKYLTFVPVLEFYFWESTPEETDARQKKKGKFDPFGFESADYKSIDLSQGEPKEFLVSNDLNAEPDVFLEELGKDEAFRFKTVGEPRKRKTSLDKTDKRKIRIKKNFGGSYMRNGSYFRHGKYSFALKTNLSSS